MIGYAAVMIKKTTHSRKEEIAKCDKSKMNTDGIGKVVSFANVSNTSTGHQDDTSAWYKSGWYYDIQSDSLSRSSNKVVPQID